MQKLVAQQIVTVTSTITTVMSMKKPFVRSCDVCRLCVVVAKSVVTGSVFKSLAGTGELVPVTVRTQMWLRSVVLGRFWDQTYYLELLAGLLLTYQKRKGYSITQRSNLCGVDVKKGG